MFSPNLASLSPPLHELWPILREIPEHFVLYGESAIALRLGHRVSVDFDFFTAQEFRPADLERDIAFLGLKQAVLQESPNTYTANLVPPGGEVKVSFFGTIDFGQVFPPDRAPDNGLKIASLRDLVSVKLKVIHQRVEAKDYLDIAAMLQSGLSLAEGLSHGDALYPRSTTAAITLQTLCWFNGGNLDSLSEDVKATLVRAATSVRDVPVFAGTKMPIGWVPDAEDAERA